MTDLSARISRAPPPSTDVAAFFSSARVQHGSPKADRLSRGLSALRHMSALAGSSNEHQQRTKGNGQDERTPIPIPLPLAKRIQPEPPQRPLWALTESGNVLTAEGTSTTGASLSLLARLGPPPRPSLLPPSGPKNSCSPPKRPLRSRESDRERAEYNRRRTAPTPPRASSPPPRSTPAAAQVTTLGRSLSSGPSRPPTPPLSPVLAESNYRPPSPDYPPPQDDRIVSLSVLPRNNVPFRERLPRISCGEPQEIPLSPHTSNSVRIDDRSAASHSPSLKRKASGDLGPSRSASPSKKPALTSSTTGGPFRMGDRPLSAAVGLITDDVDVAPAGNLAPLSPGQQSPEVSASQPGPQHTFLPPVDVAEQSGEPLSALALAPQGPSSRAVTPLRLRLSTPESIHEMPSVILDDEPDVAMFLNPRPAIFVPVVEQHHPPQPSPPVEENAPQESSELKPEEVSANGGTVLLDRSELPDNLWSDDVASRTAARLRVREELRTRCRSDGRGVDRVSWTVDGMSYRWRPLDQPADSSLKGSPVGIAESAAAAVVAPDNREEALFLEAQAFLSSIRMRGTPLVANNEPVEASSSVAGSGDSSTAPSDRATRSKTSSSSLSLSPAIPANNSLRPSPLNTTIENENGRTFTIEVPLPAAFQTSRGRGGPEYMAWQKSQIEAAQMRNDSGARTCWVQPRKIRDNVLPLMWKPPSTMSSPACPIPGAQLVKISPSQQTGAGDSEPGNTSQVALEPSLSEHSISAQVPNHASFSATGESSHSVSTPKYVDADSAGSKSSLSAQVTSTPTTHSRTVPLPAKWADRTTSELKADPDFAQWFAAQRTLMRATLSDQYGALPVNLLSSRAHGQLIFRWSSDHPQLDMSRPRGESSALAASPIKKPSAPQSDIDDSPTLSNREFLDPPGEISASAGIAHGCDATTLAPCGSSEGKQPMRSGSIDTAQHQPTATSPASELPVKQSRPEYLEKPESSQVTISVSTNPATPNVSAPASLATITSPPTASATSARIGELQRSMDAKLLALDNWFKILDSHPNRKALLDKLIDKAQDDVFELQQQIDLASARVTAVL